MVEAASKADPPGVLYCWNCPFKTTPQMDGGAYHHTLDNPGHYMTDAPKDGEPGKDPEAPLSPELIKRLLGQ